MGDLRQQHTHPLAARRKVMTARALELRLEGKSYRAIAKSLRLPHSTAWEYVFDALQETRRENAEKAELLRELELQRLDVLLYRLNSREDSDSPRVIDTMLRVMERRAKLLGLDAPTTFSGVDGGPIELALVDARAAVREKLERLRLATGAASQTPGERGQ